MRIGTMVAPGCMLAALACGDAGSGGTQAASSAAPAATAAAKAAGAATTTDACALVTPDEAGRVLSATGVKTEPLAGDPAYCTYRDGAGGILAATTYMRKDSAVAYGAWARSAKPVAGLGEKAQWEASTATLMISKGGSVLSITAGSGRMAEAERQDLAKQLGAIGVARQ